MKSQDLSRLMEDVAAGVVSPDEAAENVRAMGFSYTELGHTKLDLHRQKRRGIPEAVYGESKLAEQILDIAIQLANVGQPVLCTRVSAEKADYIRSFRPDFQYDSRSRVLYKPSSQPVELQGCVAVLAAGTSDWPVMEEAALSLELMGSKVERVLDVGVAGIHRLFASASNVLSRAKVVIVVAGMEGALPSVVAGLVCVPVIAVPTSVGYGASFAGVAALLGMLNTCSGGIGVVNIDNGFGAAMLAHLINVPQNSEMK